VALTYIISRAFPLERFGSTFGWCMLILAFAVGAGPLATSALVKLSGSYHSALIMMLIFSMLALIIAFFLNDSRVRRSQTGLANQGA
jgi:MFS-type transporter involved in bile tolerance (Atg22 family)